MALDLATLQKLYSVTTMNAQSQNIYNSTPFAFWQWEEAEIPPEKWELEHRIVLDLLTPYGQVRLRKHHKSADDEFQATLSTAVMTNGARNPIPTIHVNIDGTEWKMSLMGPNALFQSAILKQYEFDLHEPDSIDKIKWTIDCWINEFRKKQEIYGNGWDGEKK